MDIHQLCIVCKYWRISPYAQPQPGCSHERHHRLFRADDIVATFMYYNTTPSTVLLNTDHVNRERVRDSTRRFETAIRSYDDVYGITGIIILLESILYVNSVHQKLQMTYARSHGLYPPAAVHIRPDYPVPPRQQTPSFSNSLVSSTSAQLSQRTPSFSNSLVSSTSAQQSQHQQCTACIYLARNCSMDCWFAQFFQPHFWGDFEAACHTQFDRRYYAYNTRTSRQELTGAEITQIRATTTLFEREIRAKSCPDYGATGIVISLVNRLLAVNTSIDFLEEISADRVQQLVEQYHSRHVPRYPAPTNVNTGGPPQQQHQRQLQLGVSKRPLEQGESQMPQQRPRLPRPPNQPHQAAGAWPPLQQPEIPLLEPALPPPRLQQPAQFLQLYHPNPTPFQQPYPPAAFQQPSYYVQTRGYQAWPLLQSQPPAVPFQSQQLLAGNNSSSSATATATSSQSQSQFQSQQQHYFSTGSSSSAAVVGRPDPHHQAWPLLQSQPPAVPFQSQQLLAGNNSSSSATATATSSQSQFQSQQQHYFSTGSSSSAAVVGRPDPHHQEPLLQSQPPAVPFQSQQLLAGNNSSSSATATATATATSSQSQFQSQQQHYFSTGSSSSAAVVGRPDPHHQEPLLQSQPPAAPLQSQQLLAGNNSSSSATATSSQSQFQSQQQHYFSTGSSSLAAVVGQPDPHHQEPPGPYDLGTIQFSDDEKDTFWGKEQKRLAEEQKRLKEGPR